MTFNGNKPGYVYESLESIDLHTIAQTGFNWLN